MSSTVFAYLFEARGIQQYIFETGKVKDMVGASLIVDELCQFDGQGDLLQLVLSKLHLDGPEKIRFIRRAGGAFAALLSEKGVRDELQLLWTLVVHHFAPGMEWVDACSDGVSDAEAVANGYTRLAQRRNSPAATLPEAGPFVLRASRTGLAAYRQDRKEGWLDLPVWRKRQQNLDASGVGRYFLPEQTHDSCTYGFVKNLDTPMNGGEMPVAGNAEHTLGVIHADGNSLGMALQSLQKLAGDSGNYQDVYWKFSIAIATATRNAARAATQNILLPHRLEIEPQRYLLPARPLVLGGDDLTIIVRGDLALDFLAEFIRHFEKETEAELAKVGVSGLPRKLTACGGVAFIRPGHPFMQAYALAESLCDYAKKRSTETSRVSKPSSVAFYRVSTSHIGEYAEILQCAETTRHEKELYQMTLGAYALDSTSQMPRLGDLLELHKLLQGIAGSTERELLTVARQAPHLVENKYKRWRDTLKKRNGAKLDAFDKLMESLGVTNQKLPFSNSQDGLRATPFGDIHILQAVLSRGMNAENQD